MTFASDVLSFQVPCDPQAPATVRDALAEVHDGGWSLDDGLLVASELVGNAVRHSGCADAHSLTVEIGLRDGNLLISVHDPGLSGQAAEPVRTETPEPGGWGLRIIEQLSLRWGSERPDGYRVWAEVAVGASDSSS
jgi:anti-sigma regulatory factor (Ser/Thr protein kinase)